jgi:hypothetical protein
MPHDPTVIPIMRGRLILVAERYGTARVLVTTAVRELGYPAKACATAAEVLAFLTRHGGGVQCVLADLGLPDMDGAELAERAIECSWTSKRKPRRSSSRRRRDRLLFPPALRQPGPTVPIKALLHPVLHSLRAVPHVPKPPVHLLEHVPRPVAELFLHRPGRYRRAVVERLEAGRRIGHPERPRPDLPLLPA